MKRRVYLLWVKRDGEEASVRGVFSSCEKAVAYFIRTRYRDSCLGRAELLTEAAKAVLRLSLPEQTATVGDELAHVEELVVDELCEAFECMDGGDDVRT